MVSALIRNNARKDSCASFHVPLNPPLTLRGEVPEWSNGADSKSVVPARVPRVRIPVSPPLFFGQLSGLTEHPGCQKRQGRHRRSGSEA